MHDAEAHVALLRGINVGRGNRVPMAELRDLLARLGYGHVSTLLNSGNAVFSAQRKDAARAEVAIGAAVSEAFGVDVPVIVKSRRQLDAAIAGNPHAGIPVPSRLLVVFARQQADLRALAALDPLLVPPESLHIGRDAAYLYCPAGVSDSKAAGALLGRLGRGVTTRNGATLMKIAAALSSMPIDTTRPRARPGGGH